MKQNIKFLTLVAFFAAQSASAMIADVCEMSKKTGGAVEGIAESEMLAYQERLKTECLLSEKFQSIQKSIQKKYKINLTDITEYQDIRFTQRSWYETALAEETPVEKTYQIWKSQYKLPMSERGADIWDAWSKGILQLEPAIQEISDGADFDLDFLKSVHKGLFPFYPLITEHGDFAHEPNPGVLKPTESADSDNYWWELRSQKDIDEANAVVPVINANYKSLGLVSSVPAQFPSYISSILSVRMRDDQRNPGTQVLALHSSHPMVTRQNVELVLEMVHQLLQKARAGQPMVWKNRIFSPAELAYFVQQLYVRIHPFHEGNGRTSRFLQEVILRLFNLPHGASGDLMDSDTLSLDAEYYKNALDKNFKLLDKMQNCSEEYSKFPYKTAIASLGKGQLSYGCRILADRSNTWERLKKENESSSKYAEEIARLADFNRTNNYLHKAILQSREGYPGNE